MGQFFKNAIVLATGATVVAILAPVLAKGLAPAPSFAPDDSCVGNARGLIQAIKLYTQDNDAKLPPMDTVAHFQTALGAYVKDTSIFTCPATHLPYVPNSSISEHSIYEYEYGPGATMVFQDPALHANHKSTVAFLDGHIEQGGVEAGDPNRICMDRIKVLTLAVDLYVEDYDEKFPPLDTTAHAQAALLPYTHSTRVFTCPATGEPFEFNSSLSNTALAAIDDPKHTIFVQDSSAHADGVKTIGYLDGYVSRGPRPTTYTDDAANLRRISFAVIDYANDNNEHFPPLSSESVIESALGKYTAGPFIFVDPLTGSHYLFNKSLSGIGQEAIDNPAGTWLARDAVVNPDGTQNVLFADGHVKTLGGPTYLPKHISVGADNETRLIWYRSDGYTAISRLSSTGDELARAGLGQIGHVGALATSPSGLTTLEVSGINSGELWTLNSRYVVTQRVPLGHYDGWKLISIAVGSDNLPRLLWNRYDGTSAIWQASAANEYVSDQRFGSTAASDIASGLAVGTDNSLRLTWNRITGETRLWTLSSMDTLLSQSGFPAHGDWKIKSVVTGSDNNTRILYAGSGGSLLVTVSPTQQRLNSIVFPAETGWTPQEVGVGGDGNARILSTNFNGAGRLRIYNNAGALLSSHDLTPF